MIAPATQSTRSGMPAIVRLLRPRQWVKNVLVLAAPAGAGVLHRPDAMVETALAFVAFSMAASGTYCLNDAADVEADRAHPVKRHRPIANGSVSVPAARLLGVTLLLGAVAVALATAGWQLALVIAGYVTLTTAYTIWLKHIAVVDLARWRPASSSGRSRAPWPPTSRSPTGSSSSPRSARSSWWQASGRPSSGRRATSRRAGGC
jgi:decaprenyl-phosphate phosphoribosyltransferase